jgi:hypothetical protein
MIGPEVIAAPDGDIATRLVALYGRDPAWHPV